MMLFKQNFPSMIPLPKQKEIISNIEQMLSDARIEKFGDRRSAQGTVPLACFLIWPISYGPYGFSIQPIRGQVHHKKGWTVLESENGSKKIVASSTKVNVEVKEEPMDFQSEHPIDVDEIINQSNTSTQEELEMIRIGSEVETTCGQSGPGLDQYHVISVRNLSVEPCFRNPNMLKRNGIKSYGFVQ